MRCRQRQPARSLSGLRKPLPIQHSRLLGGMLPNQRATLIDSASRPLTPPQRMLKLPRRAFNSRGRTKEQTDTTQLGIFGCFADFLVTRQSTLTLYRYRRIKAVA